jgi:hypothetical protein
LEVQRFWLRLEQFVFDASEKAVDRVRLAGRRLFETLREPDERTLLQELEGQLFDGQRAVVEAAEEEE